MHESSTYQKILRDGRNEGRIFEARRRLVIIARSRFPEPDAATLAAIEAIQNLDRLRTLHDRALDPQIQDWTDLLEIAPINEILS